MVNANFGPEEITPRAFRLTGRVELIHHQWRGHHGVDPLHYFAVTAGGRPYKLCFNSRDATWLLQEMSP